MNNENNISLKSLQNHEVAPPAFLFSTIKEKIDEAEVNDLKTVFAPLYNHSAMPAVVSFEQIMQKIIATEPTNVLKQLRNHETKDRKSTRLNSSHRNTSRMPSSA